MREHMTLLEDLDLGPKLVKFECKAEAVKTFVSNSP
jgi:hypothetical protein